MNALTDHLYVLILCGGGGTRLWPRSRQKTPKQFLTKFFGEESLFSQTVERAKWLTSNEKILVVTNNDYVDEVLLQGKVLLPKNIVAEPRAMNTALAMGIGAAYIHKMDPDAVIINFASDHLVGDKQIFEKDMMLAAKAAASGDHLITVGIKPAFPHTGLGYIEAGGEKDLEGERIYEVASFKEKPDLQTAQKFLESGKYFWNAGLYVWSAKSLLSGLAKHAPVLSQSLAKIEASIGTAAEEETIDTVYNTAESISVDYALSEKANNLLLVPATFSWSDVGDWEMVYNMKEKDQDGNIVETFGDSGWHLGYETKNCLIQTESRLVASVGVEDLVIIETNDAVLVIKRSESQNVKKIIEMLKTSGKAKYL